jgi:GT2 family glycosyltransferase
VIDTSSVYVHIVTHNHANVIGHCLRALLTPESSRLHVHVTDNASSDETVEILESFAHETNFSHSRNPFNMGFCGGHNQGVARFEDSECRFLLILNPDCAVHIRSLHKLVEKFSALIDKDDSWGACTGKLLRADSEMNMELPLRLDTTGMVFTRSLRHLDRGQGQLDTGLYDEIEEVEGISGAFFLMRRVFVETLVPANLGLERDVDRVYPQLSYYPEKRRKLFDEAFFAYREDAELSLRARRLGWRLAYIPVPVAVHQRRVVPSGRASLPQSINRMSVRNRFLLQLLHWYPTKQLGSIVPGFLIRNALVIGGVLITERSSLPALRDVFRLWMRGLERRRYFKHLEARLAKRCDPVPRFRGAWNL